MKVKKKCLSTLKTSSSAGTMVILIMRELLPLGCSFMWNAHEREIELSFVAIAAIVLLGIIAKELSLTLISHVPPRKKT